MLKRYNIEIIEGDENSKELGKRSKFGGTPDWIQNDETPKCQHCKKQMTFVGQIDSFDYTGRVDGPRDYMFGDVGMIYIFFCKDCGCCHSVFQE